MSKNPEHPDLGHGSCHQYLDQLEIEHRAYQEECGQLRQALTIIATNLRIANRLVRGAGIECASLECALSTARGALGNQDEESEQPRRLRADGA